MNNPKAFVDIQVNGVAGVDFTGEDLTAEGIRRAVDEFARRGTVAICPTVMEAPDDVLEKNLRLLAAAMDEPDLQGRLLGVHLEGPFLSKQDGARGAHNADFLKDPSIEFFDKLWEWANGRISILTLAPELPGAEALIRYAAGKLVAVSIGHSEAGEDAIRMAVAAGARLSTHLGNGIPATIDRHRNPVWPQLAADELFASFITDGHHLPAAFIKSAIRAKGVERSIVTCDAASVAGLPPGEYSQRAGKVVLEESGRLSLAGTSYLAGSSATMLECMNHLASLGFLAEEELWQVGLHNPLRLLGLKTWNLAAPRMQVVYENGRFEVRE